MKLMNCYGSYETANALIVAAGDLFNIPIKAEVMGFMEVMEVVGIRQVIGFLLNNLFSGEIEGSLVFFIFYLDH